MKKQILYLGDTALKEAASYLAGVMTHAGLQFDYLASDRKFAEAPGSDYQAFILSDYPAGNFAPGELEALAKKVENGAGLVMIGGWESFTGPNREYTSTVLKDVLPVVMQPSDDRLNCPQPCLVEKMAEHSIVSGLPFDDLPPGIGGFNVVSAKPDARMILASRRFTVRRTASGFAFSPIEKSDPLLVIGTYGKGRTVAFASDVAPHWVGGLVDWGNARVSAQAPGGNAIEVGNWYAQLFANIVKWAAGLLG